MTEYGEIDPQTGEVLDEYLRAEDTERREKKRRGDPLPKEKEFAMVYTHEWMKAKLTANEGNVLMMFANEMDKRGKIVFSLAEIGDMIGVARTSAWRIIDSMVAKDVLRRRGRSWLFVNPNIIWRGHSQDRNIARVNWLNERYAKKDGRAM